MSPVKREERRVLHPSAPYLNHPRIFGDVYAVDAETPVLQVLSPLAYQKNISTCLLSLLDACLGLTEVSKTASAHEKHQAAKKVMSDFFYHEADAPNGKVGSLTPDQFKRAFAYS
jgi:hypothetical protein